MLEYFLILIAGVLLYKLLSRKTEIDSNFNLPPGHLGISILGESLQFLYKQRKFFDERHAKYGNIYKTHLFGKPTIRISGKKNLEKLFAAENKLLQSAYPESTVKIVGNSTLSSSFGRDHTAKKIKILKCFSPEFLNEVFPEASEFLTNRINDWCRSPSIAIYPECNSMFLELAFTSLVSMGMPKCERARVQTLYHDILKNLFTLPINLPGFGFHKALRAKEELKNIFLKRIKEDRKSRFEIPAILENLYKSEDSEFNDDVLVNGICELIFNAGETITATALCIVCNLAQNPRVLAKLRQELETVDLLTPPEENNNNPTDLTPEVLSKLTYLECVYKETLRSNPAVGGTYRKVLETFELEGYTIPEGWTVVLGIRETHHSDSSIPDPSSFYPERWLEKDSSKVAFLPFGTGPRRCPGKGFAQLVLKLFIIKLCQQCDYTLSEENPELVSFPTPRPKNNLTGVFVSRKHEK